MTCAATTTNGTAWWAASLSANSYPLGVGCATIAFKGSRGRRKLRCEAGAALARLLQDLAGARQQTIITSAKRRKILADRGRGAGIRLVAGWTCAETSFLTPTAAPNLLYVRYRYGCGAE